MAADCHTSHEGSNRGKGSRIDAKISGWFIPVFAGLDVRCKRLVHVNPRILWTIVSMVVYSIISINFTIRLDP